MLFAYLFIGMLFSFSILAFGYIAAASNPDAGRHFDSIWNMLGLFVIGVALWPLWLAYFIFVIARELTRSGK